jgi:predicted CoA-substrate-specific enzyme activase
MMKTFLGVDIGSVSTNLVLLDEDLRVVFRLYIRTQGEPLNALKDALREAESFCRGSVVVCGVGSTGSARRLIGEILGADVIRNEITSHAVAAIHEVPDVQTVLEIGGQDSKIIIVRDGVAVDFAMNTVCAAGTGSFLDQQASRLGIPVERFGELSLSAKHEVRIAGRCTVFAESDMVHKQQMGHPPSSIVRGLCKGLVRNYLTNVAKGKQILSPIVFQGGVAANAGIRRAFEEELEARIIIPRHYDVMGAIGVGILAAESICDRGATGFRGFDISRQDLRTTSFECQECSNLCEVVEVLIEGERICGWGDRCGRWSAVGAKEELVGA